MSKSIIRALRASFWTHLHVAAPALHRGDCTTEARGNRRTGGTDGGKRDRAASLGEPDGETDGNLPLAYYSIMLGAVGPTPTISALIGGPRPGHQAEQPGSIFLNEKRTPTLNPERASGGDGEGRKCRNSVPPWPCAGEGPSLTAVRDLTVATVFRLLGRHRLGEVAAPPHPPNQKIRWLWERRFVPELGSNDDAETNPSRYLFRLRDAGRRQSTTIPQ